MKTYSYSEKIILSFILTLLLGSLIYFLLYALPIYISPSRNGDYFIIAILWIFVDRTLLYVGILMLLMRIVRMLKNNIAFLYLFFGVANICTALLSIFLYFFGKIEVWWFHGCLLNLLVGVVILSDRSLIGIPNK